MYTNSRGQKLCPALVYPQAWHGSTPAHFKCSCVELAESQKNLWKRRDAYREHF